jgi:alpha-galactosidase
VSDLAGYTRAAPKADAEVYADRGTAAEIVSTTTGASARRPATTGSSSAATPSATWPPVFELQRIGDDTSGRDWKRVRNRGVNTLASERPSTTHSSPSTRIASD